MSSVFLRASLDQHLSARQQFADAVNTTIAAARSGNRDLTDAEQAAYATARSALLAHDAKVAEIRANLADAEEAERRQGAAADMAVRLGTVNTGERRFTVGAEPTVYRRGDASSPSWLRDMTDIGLNRANPDAMDRLARNNREVQLETRAQSTTDGAGGEFVPPLWLVTEFVALARAGRVTADRCRRMPLPPGTDSINLPRFATGTAVAEQAAQNTAVQNTDATTNSVTAAVATIAGQQVVSVQQIEQSPVNVDEIYLQDLLADYAVKLDTFVINNNAANKRGLLNVTGVNAVTYTDATPTVGELYAKIADAAQQVQVGRFLPADAIVMHPRRWAWFMAATDSSNRPLALPEANKPQNAVAFSTGTVDSAGLVGTLMGLPVYVDANVPVNLGAGLNEDRIILARFDDVILFEGTPRAEAFRETKADTLSVLLRVYNYAALHSERYPKSISVISGTGLSTPLF